MRRTLTLFAFLAIAAASSIIAIACSDFEESPAATPPDSGAPDAAPSDGSNPTNDDGGGSDPVVEISAGISHTCGLRKSGKVTCWGRNAELELGFDDPTLPDSACTEINKAPYRCRSQTDVPNLTNVAQVSAGNQFTCARLSDGAVKCWGDNMNGALGLGVVTPVTRAKPESVLGLPPNAIDVVAGNQVACARVMVGANVEVYCWGSNKHGAVGLAPAATVQGATKLTQLTNAKAVSLSIFNDVACAILADDSVACWGYNFAGGLGHASRTSGDVECGDLAPCNQTPLPVGVHTAPPVDGGGPDSGTDGDSPLTNVKEISVGIAGGCARMNADNTLRCWGYALFGQLGQGTRDPVEQPAPVTVPIGAVTGFSARGGHTCAITTDGQLKCWGVNSTGELGNNNAAEFCFIVWCKSSPQLVNLPDVTRITTGGAATFAQTSDGRFWSWGANPDGRLGHAPGTSGDLDKCNIDTKCNPIPQPIALP